MIAFGARRFLPALFLLLFGFSLIAGSAHAAGLIPDATGKCPEDYRLNSDGTASKKTPLGQACITGDRDYALADIKSLLVRIGNFFIGISGAVALLVFTVGGFMWLMSAGNSKTVERGKSLMVSGAIGLAIMFSAYTIIAFGLKQFAGSEADQYLPKVTNPNTPASAGAASFSIFKPAAGISPEQTCGKIGGACVEKGKCTGAATITGACTSSKDCCLNTKQGAQTTLCGKLGGVCQGAVNACTGPLISKMCPLASSDIRCCLPVIPVKP